MPTGDGRTFWRRYRRLFRWLLFSGLAVGSVLLAIVIWFNRVGLPDFVKDPLLTELRAHGLDLHLNQLKWRWYRGFVATDINLGRTAAPFGPQLFIDEAELRLNYGALLRFEVELDSLIIRRGRFSLPLTGPSDPARSLLSVDDIMVRLRFLPRDQWQLDNFEARCLGAQLRLTANLTNATWIRRWTQASGAKAASAPATNTLRQLVAACEAWQFPEPPFVEIGIQGDARDRSNLRIDGKLKARRASSGNVVVDNLMITGHLAPSGQTNRPVRTELNARVDRLTSPWGVYSGGYFTGTALHRATNLAVEVFDGHLQLKKASTPIGDIQNLAVTSHSLPDGGLRSLRSEVTLEANNVSPSFFQAKFGQIKAQVVHGIGLDDYAPATGTSTVSERRSVRLNRWLTFAEAQSQVQLKEARTPWGTARTGQVTAHLTATDARPEVNSSWGFWTNAAPFNLDWQTQLETVTAPGFILDQLRMTGQWRPPVLSISELRGQLYGGGFELVAELNVASRVAQARSTTDFDLHRISPFLSPNGQKWLNQYGWVEAPRVEIKAQAVLPVWTKRQTDWPTELLPTLALDGFLRCGTNSFRNAPASTAQLHFALTNGHWHIPDLAVTRPEGRVDLTYWCDTPSQDYLWTIRSQIDLKALKPLLTPGQRKGLDLFQFSAPPHIQGRLWGRWQAVERLGFEAQLVLTNFALRGEPLSGLVADLGYTNQVIRATHVRVFRGSETIEGPGAAFDLPTQTVFMTNITTHIDPLVVTRIIGPITTRAVEPYHFLEPPTVLVNGFITLPGPEDNDMRFLVEGGPFRYSKFNLAKVNALVCWRKDSLLITNLYGEFYKGTIQGTLNADFAPAIGTDLHFHVAVTNTDLRPFMQDVFSSSNRMEGALSGSLAITSMNSHDWKSWQGSGRVKVEKGLIWDIPLFGIFSMPLNSIHQGLGSSRFDEGGGNFVITNSVIYTRDLELRAPTMRLYYDGTVDFDGLVNARMEASPLRDAGPLIILNWVLMPVTKLLEYKVTGTIGRPKIELLYIPKPLLALFRPFHTLKEIFVPPAEKASSAPTPIKDRP